MIFSLIILATVTLLILCLTNKSGREHRVSKSWLSRHNNEESKEGEDGVCWSWPIDKLRSENGLWNRHIENRRRAS